MRLEICCENRLGITQDILEILVRHQIDLQGIEVHQHRIYLNFPTIEFVEFQHLMPEIRLIGGVTDVKTVPFMPFERQHYELTTCLKSETDAIFSVDDKGKIIRANGAGLALLKLTDSKDLGNISHWVKGLNIQRWLDKKNNEKLWQVAEVQHQVFEIELHPIWLPGEQKSLVFSGAFIRLHSSRADYPLANQQEFLLNQVVQHSAPMRKLVRDLKKLARTELPIVISGEAGTGKSFFASLCHYLSAHSVQGVDSIDCVSLSGENLLVQIKDKITTSKLGSLILRHIDQLDAASQSKLFALLTDIARDKEWPVRLIATSQQALANLVHEGLFNENLYQLLNQLSLTVPPLRERKSDMPVLIDILLRKACNRFERSPVELEAECKKALIEHNWLGNVAQFEKALNQAILTHSKDKLCLADFDLPNIDKQYYNLQADLSGSLDDAVKRFENALLRQLYPHYPSTRQLAQKLGLSHTAIANKLRDYGINKHTVKIIKN